MPTRPGTPDDVLASVKRLLPLACCAVLFAAGVAHGQEDVEGSADHPLLSRFPGSTIVQYDHKNFDEQFWLTDEKIRVEGRITRIAYQNPKEHSTLEIFRSYQNALRGAGFEEAFACQTDQCPSVSDYLDLPAEAPIGRSERFFEDGRRALVAKRGDNYVLLLVYTQVGDRVVSRVRIVEGESLEQNLIQVDASKISDEIEATGSIALYGIYFDSDRAEVRPESAGSLREIARYLASAPGTKLYVVGHTDNTGALEYNIDLSKRRAEAVVAALTGDYAVAPERLVAQGVGPIAPVASNLTEEGRAKNRRVQLVAQ